MKSKKLIRDHVEPLLKAGLTQREFAQEMSFKQPNYVSMLLSDNYPDALMSPNRICTLADVCGLTDEQVVELTLARLDDAKGKPVEMSAETLRFVMRAYARTTAWAPAGGAV